MIAGSIHLVLFVMYLLFSLVQGLTYWGIWARLAFKSFHAKDEKPVALFPFSVIVCARNEAQNLRQNLPTILAQQFDDEWELIVVDDASEDETSTVLAAFQTQFPNRFRVLRLPEKTFPGKKYALSQGIAQAKHAQILLTDADGRPASPHWLAHMAKSLAEKPETEIVLGYGPLNRAEWPFLPNWPRYEAASVAGQYCALALAGMPYMGVGRNLAFRKEIFERVGGFSAHAHLVSGDDDLLVNAAATARNTALCLDPEAFVYSDSPSSFKAWLRQKQRHLSASPAYRWPHKMVLGALALSQVGHYALFFCLIFTGFEVEWTLGIFVFRQITLLFIQGKVWRKLGVSDLIPWIPVYDALAALQFALITPWFLLFKQKVAWFRD